MARCSICGTVIRSEDPVTSCQQCGQDYHAPCWSEIGGCATYGCKAAAEAKKTPPPVHVGMGWGDEKPCPNCKQQIASSLLVCRCGARFPWADPMTEEEYDSWREDEDRLRSSKRLIVSLFILSFVGPVAPLSGLVALLYARKRRKKLTGADGTYLAMAYGSAALGGVYLVILGLLALGL